MRRLIVFQLVNDKSTFKINSSLIKPKLFSLYLGISGLAFRTSKRPIFEQVGKGSK